MTQPIGEAADDQLEAMERSVDDQLDPDQRLDLDQVLGDDDVDAALDTAYSPPERPLAVDEYGTTAAEQEHGETLDQRLAREVPDPNLAADLAPGPVDDDGVPLDEEVGGEVGDLRAGRLVDPDEGLGEDTEKDLVGSDVGIDAGAATAEEAAVHVIPDPDLDDLDGDLDEVDGDLAR